jgi:hypothetical protein
MCGRVATCAAVLQHVRLCCNMCACSIPLASAPTALAVAVAVVLPSAVTALVRWCAAAPPRALHAAHWGACMCRLNLRAKRRRAAVSTDDGPRPAYALGSRSVLMASGAALGYSKQEGRWGTPWDRRGALGCPHALFGGLCSSARTHDADAVGTRQVRPCAAEAQRAARNSPRAALQHATSSTSQTRVRRNGQRRGRRAVRSSRRLGC